MKKRSRFPWGLVVLGLLPAAGRAQPAEDPAAPVRRDLAVRLDFGGTEPGTSRRAFEGSVGWRGIPEYELQAGWSYSDQVYFSSNRGYATAYRYYDDGMSYVKADASLRRYDYPRRGAAPNPDSSAYEWVPRGELEVSHLFSPAWRATVQYQLFPASFFWDPSSWTVNHKLSAQVELTPISALTLGGRAALLRDPDPAATVIHTSPAAPATKVAYRTTTLVGGFAAVDLRRVALRLEVLPNRDLDNSYAWSLLGTVDVRVTRRLDVRLQAIHDRYSGDSTFSGREADIVMGAVGWAVNDALRLRGGYRYVDVPAAPAPGSVDLARRRDGTVVVGLEYRPAL